MRLFMQKFEAISVLYIDDDCDQVIEAVDFLELICGKVYSATEPKKGLELYEDYSPNIVITDLKMPTLSGLDIAKKIRAKNENVAIFITTAYTTENALIEGINVGITGWLKKPVEPNELETKIKTVYENFFTDETITIAPQSTYHIHKQTLRVQNKDISLTRKEKLLLNTLLRNAGNIVPYKQIEYGVWHDSFMSDEALRTVIKTLRKKIPGINIVNERHNGYKIEIL